MARGGCRLIFRMRQYTVVPGKTKEFNEFFYQRLLPIQARHGARLIGRWQTMDGSTIVVLWVYESLDDYARVQSLVESDPETATAKGYRDTAIGRLYEACSEHFLHSTLPMSATELAHLALPDAWLKSTPDALDE
jgi:8-oxo-dGTP diphosphatase